MAQVSSLDLANCDREPIHRLGRIQAFGFLIGTSPDWIVRCASENAEDFIGRTARQVIGLPLADLLGSESVHRIRNRLQFLRGQEGVEQLRNLRIGDDGPLFDCSLHVSGDLVMLEFEPFQPHNDHEDDIDTVRAMMARLGSVDNVARLCSDAARYLQALVGFDRVMVYRFLPDDCGEVVAEAKRSSLEPFLNLRYPASDIPKQARALYLRNPIRLIADASDPGTTLYPPSTPGGDAIDLSQSVLRSVSPVHLEYLANMGVATSMSVSIVVEGRLWGLFACHHGKPTVLSQSKRSAANLFGQMFSLLLTGKQAAEASRADDRVRELTNAFTSSVVPNEGTLEQILPLLRDFLAVVEADGLGVVVDGHVHLEGVAPTNEEFTRIVKYLNESSMDEIFATSELRTAMPAAADFAARAAGALVVPISRAPRDYIVFFRREVVRKVNWAGNPEKPVEAGPQGKRLTPRKSFQAWQATVEGQSEAWTGSNLRAASQLRVTLLEVVLRLSDEASRERKSAQERQELLVAELNHRVRNILGLVRGLISQSRSEELTTAEYVAILSSRIQALARAHDQITSENWTASSFRDLLMTEAESYLLNKANQVALQGDDYLLEPVAFSAVALVIHELVTNAAKYGALSTEHGAVVVETRLSDSGGLQIGWEEKGGPAVQPPSRRGFGSTIVERLVPYELNGRARVDYRLAGLQAHFEIPAHYVKQVKKPASSAAESAACEAAAAPASVPGSVLVVEDNLIIGLEAESIFRDLGCEQVKVVGNLEEARAAVKEVAFDFAVLDVNLGTQTSFVFAEELLGTPVKFAFASGYGDTANYPEALRAVPRVAKPYDKEAILKVLSAA